MRHLLFNTVSAASLMLCVVSFGAWVESYRHINYLKWMAVTDDRQVLRQFEVCIRRGKIYVSVESDRWLSYVATSE